MSPIQVFYAIAVGVMISVLGQMVVDWWRRRNAVVSIEQHEELVKLVYRLKSAVEIETGISINGIDYRKLRRPAPEEDRNVERSRTGD